MSFVFPDLPSWVVDGEPSFEYSAHTRSSIFEAPYSSGFVSHSALMESLDAIDPDIKAVIMGDYMAQLPEQSLYMLRAGAGVHDTVPTGALPRVQSYMLEQSLPNEYLRNDPYAFVPPQPLSVADVPFIPAVASAPLYARYSNIPGDPSVSSGMCTIMPFPQAISAAHVPEPASVQVPRQMRVMHARGSTPPLVPAQWTKCHHHNCGQLLNKGDPEKVKEHMQSHNKARPVICGYCSRAFSRKHDLERHARVHSGDKPYVCSVCKKGFPRSDALRRHIRVEKETHQMLLHGEAQTMEDRRDFNDSSSESNGGPDTSM